MTKAKASKLKANDQPASRTRQTPASKLSLVKSTKVIARETAPKTATAPKLGKIDKIIAMMRRPKGATIDDLTKATAWQAHSVRGAISGTLRKKQGLNVISEKSGDVRLYRIADVAVG
jgi:hypothetical protein